jgi:hypothetical protein
MIELSRHQVFHFEYYQEENGMANSLFGKRIFFALERRYAK